MLKKKSNILIPVFMVGLLVILLVFYSSLMITGLHETFPENKLYVGKKSRIEALKLEHVLDVPFIFQKPWYCSEASASMVLQYYGYNFTQDQIHNLGYDRFENMLPFIQKYVNGHYDSLKIDDLKREVDEGKPVIIRVLPGNYLHTVVVVGYDENYIYIHDPAVGAYLQTNPKTLLKIWEPTNFKAIVFDV